MTKADRIIRDHELDGYGDTLFPALAAEHPENCSCPEDYPGWNPSMGCVPAPKQEDN